MAGISVWQLAIIAVIVALLFGTKRLKGLGSDLGEAINGFRQAVEPKSRQIEPTEEKSQSASSAKQ